MYQRLYTVFSTGLMALFSIVIIAAQSNCDAFLTDALFAVGDNCANTGRNEVCYGYNQVEASFLREISTDVFTQPSDLAGVSEVETIRTAPLNSDAGTWGVVVMNIQANLPNTLPGQSVTFVLMGDTEIENAVDPDNAFEPSDGIDVQVNIVAGANIRSGPGLNFNVIGGVAFEDTLLADGVSEDGEWLRVAYRERPAWISITVLEENEDIATLPTLTDDLQTPMQAIYLRTGIGEPECETAPDDLLLVQGPENVEISITVNGADITLGSSGAIRVIEIDGELFLEIIVFDGTFEVDEQTILPGQRSILCLDDEDSPGADGDADNLIVTCEASEPEAIPADEFGEIWCVMEQIPLDILNYSIEVLCPGEIPPGTGSNPVSNAPVSEIQGVDCSTFSLPPQPIVASNFTLSWTAATGANEYHVVVFDSNGVQTKLVTGITGTSVGLNGGVGFANSGSVHVRAFRDGQYACFVALNYDNRVPDPNEPPGGYPEEEPAGLTAVINSCEFNDGITFSVSYNNASDVVTVDVGGYLYFGSPPSGTISDSFVPSSPSFIIVSDDDDTISLSTSVCTFPF